MSGAKTLTRADYVLRTPYYLKYSNYSSNYMPNHRPNIVVTNQRHQLIHTVHTVHAVHTVFPHVHLPRTVYLPQSTGEVYIPSANTHLSVDIDLPPISRHQQEKFRDGQVASHDLKSKQPFYPPFLSALPPPPPGLPPSSSPG